ncbi:MAG: hypothetical protein QXT13_10300 [Pyrobaculum sp.]
MVGEKIKQIKLGGEKAKQFFEIALRTGYIRSVNEYIIRHKELNNAVDEITNKIYSELNEALKKVLREYGVTDENINMILKRLSVFNRDDVELLSIVIVALSGVEIELALEHMTYEYRQVVKQACEQNIVPCP